MRDQLTHDEALPLLRAVAVVEVERAIGVRRDDQAGRELVRGPGGLDRGLEGGQEAVVTVAAVKEQEERQAAGGRGARRDERRVFGRRGDEGGVEGPVLQAALGRSRCGGGRGRGGEG